MAIDVLDHGQRRVAEDLGKLDRVHPPRQRPGCIGVAKEMRVNPLLYGSRLCQVTNQLVNARSRKRLIVAIGTPPQGDEQAIANRVVRPSTLGVLNQAPIETRNGNEPFPAAFSPDSDEMIPVSFQDVRNPQAYELADPKPGISHETDDELVSLGLCSILHALDLVAAEDVHQLLGQLGKLCLGTSALSFPLCPGEEPVNRAHVGVDRVSRQLTALSTLVEKVSRQAIERSPVQSLHRFDAMLGAPGDEDIPERVAIRLAESGWGQSPGSCIGQVVFDQSRDRSNSGFH